MKTILVTGASSGIGKATAQHFITQGWNVIATMRSPEKETELVGDNLLVTKLDVTDAASIQSAIDAGVERFGQIDVVLNNAGYGTAGAFEAASDEQVRRQFEVNVFGLMAVTRAALPHFRANNAGLFINISSIGGLITFPAFSLYHATKRAVEGFSESLSYELAPLGIRVKIVEPGGVKTDFAGRSLDMLEDENLSVYDPTVNALKAIFSDPARAGSYSEPEDIAAVIYTAATDESDRMRYLAGDDAKAMWAQRQEVGDDMFRAGITQMFLS